MDIVLQIGLFSEFKKAMESANGGVNVYISSNELPKRTKLGEYCYIIDHSGTLFGKYKIEGMYSHPKSGRKVIQLNKKLITDMLSKKCMSHSVKGIKGRFIYKDKFLEMNPRI